MKKVIKLLIIFSFFFVLRVYAVEESLYDVSFGEDIFTDTEFNSSCWSSYTCRNNAINKYWPSNNTRTYYYKVISEGDTSDSKYYLYYSNVYPDSTTVQNSTDKRALAQDEYFTITLDNLNIDVSKYKDIRLNVDYASLSSASDLMKMNGFMVESYDASNNKIGTFYLDDYSYNGFYKNASSDMFFHGYDLISDNLKASNTKIKKVKLIPFGNLPKSCAYSTVFESGDWFCQTSFFVGSIKITGYTDSNYSNPNVTYERIDVNETRLATARRLYDLATIKWVASHDINSIRSVGGFKYGTTVYTSGATYYGPPYTQINRVLVETFNDVLNEDRTLPYITVKNSNGEDIQSPNTWGDDCSASVSYSIAKYLPITNMYNTTDFIFDRNKTKLLGGLEIDGKTGASDTVYSSLYQKYKTMINNNQIPADKRTSFETGVKHRIKSNDARVWLTESILGDDGVFYPFLGYTVRTTDSTMTAVPAGESFKLFVDDLDIPANKYLKVKLEFVTNETATYDVKMSDINTDNAIIRMCTSSGNCTNLSSIILSKPSVLVKDNDGSAVYKKAVLSATATTTEKITSIQILPFGNQLSGKVFRVSSISINASDEVIVDTSASHMVTYFNLANNVESDGRITAGLINQINGNFTTASLNDFFAVFLARQDVYKGYAEQVVGDVSSRHTKGQTHVRLITGSTYAECLDGYVLSRSTSNQIVEVNGNCDAHGGFNSAKSYFIRSDINSGHTSTTYRNRNNYGGSLNSKDTVPSWTPNSAYTDIKNLGELKGKNLDFFINRKETFDNSMNNQYLPIRMLAYNEGKVEKTYARFLDGNTLEDIKNGFKGSVYSNYAIVKLDYYIKDLKTGNVQEFAVYPEHGLQLNGTYTDEGLPKFQSGQKEGVFVNHFSLYYNTPENVQEAVKGVLQNTDDFEVRVTVDAGKEKQIKLLDLTTRIVDKISVSKVPDQLVYEINGTLSLTGGELLVEYVNGVTETIKLDAVAVNISGFDSSSEGVKKLTVEYGNKTTTFDVEVVKGGVKNPGTGAFTSLGILFILLVLGFIIFEVSEKSKKFRQI